MVFRFIEQESSALKDALLELVTSCTVLNEFASVWGRIGLSISQRQVRRETIVLHVTNLLKDIVQEEFELEKTMISSLNNNMKELTTLSEQLGLPKEDVSVDLMVLAVNKSGTVPSSCQKSSLSTRRKSLFVVMWMY